MTSGKTFHCGTLTYTRAGIAGLFAWLLWGDFCFIIMQSVVPSILPLKLKDLGATNIVMGIILTALPSMLNMTVCPYVSFKSDRYRSKWGRRIPFILWTLPFLCLSLVCLGCSEDIAKLLQTYFSSMKGISPAVLAIAVIGIFMVSFQFFDMFVSSVFWYLFNDVVPPNLIGRFVGTFRIVGTLAGAIYNYFIFKYAETNVREIFIGASILYFIGIGMMCLLVKEGEYPPVDDTIQKSSRGFSGLKTFFKESFSHKLYWTKFIYTGSCAVCGASGVFQIFFYKDMGLTVDDIGKATGIMGIVGMSAMYFAAIFVDRWHPLRIITYSSIFAVAATATGWVWLFVTLPPEYFFWLHVMGAGLICIFHNVLLGAASLPMDMRLSPKSRFGQFCSAQALLRSFCTMFAGFAIGVFFDMIRRYSGGTDYAYRYIFVWTTLFSVVSAALSLWLYVQWHRLGGDKDFHPPAPWSPDGREEIEQTPYVGPQTRWLKIALLMFKMTMLFSVIYLIPLVWWMKEQGWGMTLDWHLRAILPAALLTWIAWLWVERRIKADLKRVAAGEAPLNGIPHHGVLVVQSAIYLLLLGIWMDKTLVAVCLGMTRETLVFGIGNIITNLLLIASVMILCWIERARPPMLDYDGRKERA